MAARFGAGPKSSFRLGRLPLNSNDGEAYTPAGSYSTETLVGPLYPNGKETPIGTCRKGWLPFEVPRKWKPDYVEYNPGYNKILTWRPLIHAIGD